MTNTNFFQSQPVETVGVPSTWPAACSSKFHWEIVQNRAPRASACLVTSCQNRRKEEDDEERCEGQDFAAMLDNRGFILSSLPEQERERQLKKWYFLGCMIEEAPCNEKLEKRRMIQEQGFEAKKIRVSMDLFKMGKGMMAQKMNRRPGESYEDDRQGEGSADSLLPGLHDDIALDFLARTSRSDYGSIASLNRRFNSLIRTGYLYRLRRQLGMVEPWIYMVCDLIGWEAFDPNRQRWMRLPRIPSDECFNYTDKESLAVGTELLVFGRELSGFVIWRYSLLTHSWSRGRGMKLPRCLFGSSSCGEIAIVAGGSDRHGAVLKSAELYNSEMGTWETLPDMHSPRKLCSGFFMDGKFYVIGGMMNHTDTLTCGEEYNLQTRTWRRIWNMFPGGNGAGHAPPLVAVVNNQLYAVEYLRNEVKKYNKENNTWSVLDRLPVGTDSTTGWGLAFKACGNELLVIGGQRGPEGESIVLNSWRPTSEARGPLEWNVLAVKERAGVFVYNCAVMGC